MSDRRQLLIVEDDDVFARTLKRSFERRGYEVRVASSPDEAEALLAGWRPGYAVVDLKPFAADARAKIGSALAEFRKSDDSVRVDAAVTDLRMAGIAFDSKTLRIIAEATGTVRVAVNKLPAL